MQTTVHQTAWVTVYANNCTPNCLGHSVCKQLHIKLPGSQCMQTTAHQTAWVTVYANNCTPNCLGHSVYKQLHTKLPGSQCMQTTVHQTAWVTASVCKQLHIKLPGSKCMQRIVHQTAWVTVHANNCTSNCLSDSFTHRHKISPPPQINSQSHTSPQRSPFLCHKQQ